GRLGNAEIERRIEPEPRPHEHVQMWKAPERLERRVTRAAIDDDVLDIAAAHGARALDRLGYEAFGIEGRRDDREPHRRAGQSTRPSVPRSAAGPRSRRSAA